MYNNTKSNQPVSYVNHYRLLKTNNLLSNLPAWPPSILHIEWGDEAIFLDFFGFSWWKQCTFVGIQTATLLVTLWISYEHPVHIKCNGWLFEFLLSITLAVIWISRTVAGSRNWMSSKESLRVSSHSILITRDQKQQLELVLYQL